MFRQSANNNKLNQCNLCTNPQGFFFFMVEDVFYENFYCDFEIECKRKKKFYWRH